jgi:hypothetical protein
MTLEDARIILGYHQIYAVFCDVLSTDEFYDSEFAYDTARYADFIAALDWPEDAHEIYLTNQLEGFTCALHVINRALPVTLHHATMSRYGFVRHVSLGKINALRLHAYENARALLGDWPSKVVFHEPTLLSDFEF